MEWKNNYCLLFFAIAIANIAIFVFYSIYFSYIYFFYFVEDTLWFENLKQLGLKS